MTADTYAGDVTSSRAWEMLGDEPDTMLIDVRTDAEWRFVGAPELSSLGKELFRVSWQTYPEMRPNSAFVEEVRELGLSADATLLLLCRSGQRSCFAASALTVAGFANCYNVSDGFEGTRDGDGHRGVEAGWKAAGLPWVQP